MITRLPRGEVLHPHDVILDFAVVALQHGFLTGFDSRVGRNTILMAFLLNIFLVQEAVVMNCEEGLLNIFLVESCSVAPPRSTMPTIHLVLTLQAVNALFHITMLRPKDRLRFDLIVPVPRFVHHANMMSRVIPPACHVYRHVCHLLVAIEREEDPWHIDDVHVPQIISHSNQLLPHRLLCMPPSCQQLVNVHRSNPSAVRQILLNIMPDGVRVIPLFTLDVLLRRHIIARHLPHVHPGVHILHGWLRAIVHHKNCVETLEEIVRDEALHFQGLVPHHGNSTKKGLLRCHAPMDASIVISAAAPIDCARDKEVRG
mmetsp:Transcript_5674/g.15964  ORF Transcript_5674/g.15964 Transcript_5674/m.15964 type:complete len:315 (-) Transcript_5674:89-1033(-)